MPIDKKKYPENWKTISHYIRTFRANNRCEWCGVENYKPHPLTGSKVILTVAHLGVPLADGTPGNKHDKMDCRPENLAALCQRCHLGFDRSDHLAVQRKNRLMAAAQCSERESEALWGWYQESVIPGSTPHRLDEWLAIFETTRAAHCRVRRARRGQLTLIREEHLTTTVAPA